MTERIKMQNLEEKVKEERGILAGIRSSRTYRYVLGPVLGLSLLAASHLVKLSCIPDTSASENPIYYSEQLERVEQDREEVRYYGEPFDFCDVSILVKNSGDKKYTIEARNIEEEKVCQNLEIISEAPIIEIGRPDSEGVVEFDPEDGIVEVDSEDGIIRLEDPSYIVGVWPEDIQEYFKKRGSGREGPETGITEEEEIFRNDVPCGPRIVSEAEKHLGTPYRKMVCSDLSRIAAKDACGVDLPRRAAEQYEYLERKGYCNISKSELMPGDLLFFSNSRKRVGHVVILKSIDGGTYNIIHSSSSRGKVVYDSVGNNYWRRLVGACRPALDYQSHESPQPYERPVSPPNRRSGQPHIEPSQPPAQSPESQEYKPEVLPLPLIDMRNIPIEIPYSLRGSE